MVPMVSLMDDDDDSSQVLEEKIEKKELTMVGLGIWYGLGAL